MATLGQFSGTAVERDPVAGGKSNGCVCGKKCLVYARVTGYMTPVMYWNLGKKSEYADRRMFNISKSLKKLEESSHPPEITIKLKGESVI